MTANLFAFRPQPCQPPGWALSGHAQTLLGHLLPSQMLAERGERHEIKLPDNDRLVAFLLKNTSDTVVYLFHGLPGSTDSHYMHRTAQVCQKLKHNVFMVNHRGCGAGAELAYRPYHSGRAEDLSAALEYGRRLFPSHRHVAVGFSLSGNALLLLLSGLRGDVKPDAAVSVNAPIHLQEASYSLKTGLNRIYDLRFVLQCRKDVLRHNRRASKQYKVPLWATIYDFDEIYTAPAAGFANRENYYQSCSTHTLLSHISIPTLILTAQDDPFVNYQNFVRASLSQHVHLHIEKVGGHMGYISRPKTPLGTFRWLDYALHEALRIF